MRRRLLVSLVALVTMLGGLLVVRPMMAEPLDPAAAEVVQGLLAMSKAVASASAFPSVSQDLPLTQTSVRDALGLDTTLGTFIRDRVAGRNPTLGTFDDIFTPGSRFAMAEATPAPGSPAGTREWDATITVLLAAPIALAYDDGRLVMGAGAIDGELAASLTGTMRLRYDPTQLALRRFSVVGNSPLVLRAWTRSTGSDTRDARSVAVPPFPVVDGFVELEGHGSALVDVTTTLRMRDPNGRGLLTAEDLQLATPDELLTQIGSFPATDDRLSIDVALRAPILDGSDHGRIRGEGWSGDPQKPFAAPAITRDAVLGRLTALSRAQAIGSFSQFVAAMRSVESEVDADLPLLDASLTDLHSPASALQGIITEQAAATIVCGAADTLPPTGAVRPGQARFCQATTSGLSVDPDRPITWSSPDPAVQISRSAPGTVGSSPRSNVLVSGGGGFPRLRVSFSDTEGATHTARSGLVSVQQLAAAIDDAGLGGSLAYRPATSSLEIVMQQEQPDLVGAPARTGGSSTLSQVTGLSGLCQALPDSSPRRCPRTGDGPDAESSTVPTGAATLDARNRAFDATFGIGLVPEADAPRPNDPAPVSPVTYVKPGVGGLLWRIGSIAAHLPQDAPLVARIGFLQVDVDVRDYSLTSGEQPAASVVLPTGTVHLFDADVTGAVDVTRLFEGGNGAVSAVAPVISRPLTATAGLRVRDTPVRDAERLLGVDADLQVQWSTLAPGALPTVAASPGYQRLRALDLVPSRQATAGSGSSGAHLVDPTADFVTQFGVDPNASVDRRTVRRRFTDLDVSNLIAEATAGGKSAGGAKAQTVADPGGLCAVFVVVDAHTIDCTEGPLVEGAGLSSGHRYVMDGNPTAVRDSLIEALASVVSVYATPDVESGFSKTLPLVDLRPDEISGALDALQHAVGGLQSEAASDTGTGEVSTLQGFARAIARNAPGMQATLGLQGGGAGRLEMQLSYATDESTLSAPLRIAIGDRQLSVLVAGAAERTVVSVPLRASSRASVHLGIDLTDGSASVGNDTELVQKLRGFTADDSTVRNGLAARPAEYGALQATTGAAAGIRLGIGLQVTSGPSAGTSWMSLEAMRAAMRQTRARLGDAQTCADSDTAGAAACAVLPLVDGSSNNLTTIDVSLLADQSSGGSGGALAAQPVAYRFLADSLAGLGRSLRTALDGGQVDMSLPLVGTDLDGGSDIPAKVDGYAGAARGALAALTIAQTDTATSLATKLHDALAGAPRAGTSVTVGTVTMLCNDAACGGSATVADVDEVRVPITLRGLQETTAAPFAVGPAGLSVLSDGTVESVTSWSVPVTLGIKRGAGPFLLMVPASGSTVPVLQEHIETRLPVYATGSCHPWTRIGATGSKSASTTPADRAVGSRCIDALVGKFPSVLVARNGAGTAVTGVFADLVVAATPRGTGPADAQGRVFLPALYESKLPTATSAIGDGAVDVYFESFAGDLGFFDVVGTLKVVWKDGQWTDAGAQFDNLQIDAETVYDIVDIGYGKAAKYLTWLNPVMDFLSYKIPVVSDLAELAGQPPVTPLFMMTKAMQVKFGPKAATAFEMIAKVAEFQQLLARLPGRGDTAELVDLGAGRGGAFKMPKRTIQFNSCSKTAYATGKDGAAFTQTAKDVGTSGRCTPSAGDVKKKYKDDLPIEDKTAGKNLKSQLRKGTYFSLPNISLPVLEDPTSIYGLLRDNGDTTLLSIDMGHLGAKATWERYFGPFMIGPVPITATVGAELGLDGRFAFGFDTKGLSARIADLDSPGAVHDIPALSRGQVFSEGFFIDDRENGKDVPEIKVTANIYAGASVSLLLAEAGVRGGVQFDLSIDAFDPNKDGKIYTSEFVGSSVNPDCVFDVSSGVEFYLQAFLWLKLFLIEIDKRWDIIRSPRLKIFEFECQPQEPVLAYREGDDLWLTMGDKVARRNAYPEVTDEKYIVRQMGTAPNGDVMVDVSAFKLVQHFTLPPNGKIRVAGGSGADTITMADGQILGTDAQGNPTVTAVPFTLATVIDGGAGPDQISTERGADTIDGGTGDDKIRAGAGDDTVRGGAGRDSVDGGIGHDTIDGDDGDDRLSGDTGPDLIRGGAGDDLIDGAPGIAWDQLFPTTDLLALARLLDTGDVLVGGTGSDQLNGGDGSDLVVGGTYDREVGFGSTIEVPVFGVDSLSGLIVALRVPVQTATLPDVATVRADCALPGTSSVGERDVVSGGDQRDYVLGGAGADELSGGGGDDLVCGRSGDDLLLGDGADVRPERQGDDEVLGGPGADRLFGDGGTDLLRGEAGDDLLRGGDGGDSLDGGLGADVVLGEGGADLLGGDRIEGAEPIAADDAGGDARAMVCSDETTFVRGRADLNGDLSSNGLDNGRVEGLLVVGGVIQDPSGKPFTGVLGGVPFFEGKGDFDGNGFASDEAPPDTFTGDTHVAALASVFGAQGDGDCLIGGDGADVLRGDEGGDVLDAGSGDDVLHGGGGRDFLRGRAGADAVYGDAGNDLLAGDSDDDLVVGGRGDDVVRGGSGADRLVGGSGVADVTDGRDELLGDGGNDVLAGGNATIDATAVTLADAISGRTLVLLATPASTVPALEYDDQLFGGFGDDWVFGQGGDDLVRGGGDRDHVEGGPGSDTVQGDDGSDVAIGGSSTEGAFTLLRSGAGIADGGDVVLGDGGVDGLDGNDVVIGDNARVTFADAGVRTVQLFDVQLAAGVAFGGGDRLSGGGGNDLLLGQGGDDLLDGGDGDDVLEGNAGRDELHGGSGQDDLLGGGSVNDGLLSVSASGRYLAHPDPDPGASGLADDDDSLFGDDGADVLLGDNGRIVRTPGGESGTHALRTVRMSDTTAGATSGSDRLDGGAGDDDLYGQLDDTGDGGGQTVNGEAVAGDVLVGGTGDDMLSGDLAVNVPTPAANLGTPNGVLSLTSGFVREQVRRSGTLVDVVTLVAPTVGGADVLLGGSGDDAIHGGAGDDLANGGDGDDVVFGHLGADSLWGGTGHDLLFGGADRDLLDLKWRATDSALARVVAPVVDMDRVAATTNGNDTVYGGSGADILQADSGDQGKSPGDRLIDWTGPFNRYLVCGSGLGAPKVQLSPDPPMQTFLTDLVRALGSVGLDEVSFPAGQETGPSFGGGPAQSVCEG